jgi:hypothetical protein
MKPGIRGVWTCEVCDRVLREERDDFLIRNDEIGTKKAYCEGHVEKATSELGRRGA